MKILPFFIFILISYGAISQDNIIKIDGEEIAAKVIGVELKLITYKRFDNIDGPTYSISKADVFMIQYENGTKDVFNQMTGVVNNNNNKSNKEPVITPPNFTEDSLIIRNYIFVNGEIRAGILPTKETDSSLNPDNRRIYKNIGYTVGMGLEIGSVFYLTPRKMPKNFGLGLNITWANLGVVADGVKGVSIFPYTISAGPQFSFQVAPNTLLDAFVKPGMSLNYIGDYIRPTFQTEIGVTIRYKSFMIGLSGAVMANWYADYSDTYNRTISFSNTVVKVPYTYKVPYNYSHIKVRIGAAIQGK
jgi:hypothetical protein